jgi:hypothetical protein
MQSTGAAEILRANLRLQYGFPTCDPRWVDVMRKDGYDGELAVDLLLIDQCHILLSEILSLRDSPHFIIRDRVAQILGGLRGEGTEWVLLQYLSDEDDRVVAHAAYSLCHENARLYKEVLPGAVIWG